MHIGWNDLVHYLVQKESLKKLLDKRFEAVVVPQNIEHRSFHSPDQEKIEIASVFLGYFIFSCRMSIACLLSSDRFAFLLSVHDSIHARRAKTINVFGGYLKSFIKLLFLSPNICTGFIAIFLHVFSKSFVCSIAVYLK